MDNNNLDVTLKQILEQLKDINTGLTNGNLIGDDNRLFGTSRRGFGSRNVKAAERRESLKNTIEQLEAKLKTEEFLSYKTRQGIKDKLKRTKRQYALESVKAGVTPAAITTAVKNISNAIFTVLETNIKKQTIKLQAASELQTRAIQTYGKALNNAIGVQIGNITGTVLDTAYQSFNAVLDNGRALYMKSLSDSITYRKKENELYKAKVEQWGSVVDSVSGTMAAFGGTVGIIGNVLSVVGDIGKRAFMYEAKKAEFEIMRSEEVKKAQDEWLQQIESVVKGFADMSKQVTKSFIDAGNSAYVYGRSLGLGKDGLRKYHDAIIEGVNVALSNIGMDYADYMKMQSSYNEATGGRMGILGTQEAKLLGGLAYRMNISKEEAASLTGSINIFNTSIEDGTDMLFEMSKIANRMGLNVAKFAKDMERNLKLAEKYQFRGGVKGVMEMALWAQKTRLSMEELSSYQEKALSGNIEEIIQTSARLNVLGGRAALFSDPMSMLYNALANPRGLAESFNKMVGGYGTFNYATGETEFNTAEMLRMAQIAQATGQSRESVMNQARQAQKSQVIGRRYGGRFSKDTLEGITQHATWSRDRNDWIIKVNAPGEESGFKEVGLNELYGDNDQRLKNIFPEDKQDRLIDYVQDIRNYLSPGEWQAASEKNSIAVITKSISELGMFGKQKQFADERFRITRENAIQNAEIVNKITDATWEAQRQMNEAIQNGNISKLVGEYTSWSMIQNADMLEQMSGFVSSGVSINDHLQNIEDYIYGRSRIETQARDILENSKIGRQLLQSNSLEEISQAVKTYRNYSAASVAGMGSNIIDKSKIEKLYSGEATIKNGKYKEVEVRDAVITPRGVVYTHPDDMIAAFKPNGALSNSMNETSKIEINGTLRLETGNQSIDLLELVKNDPQFFRELTENVLIEASKNKYGGRSMHAPNRFTIG